MYYAEVEGALLIKIDFQWQGFQLGPGSLDVLCDVCSNANNKLELAAVLAVDESKNRLRKLFKLLRKLM